MLVRNYTLQSQTYTPNKENTPHLFNLFILTVKRPLRKKWPFQLNPPLQEDVFTFQSDKITAAVGGFHFIRNADFIIYTEMYCLSTAKTLDIPCFLPKSYKNNRTKNKREAVASLLFLPRKGLERPARPKGGYKTVRWTVL